MTCRRPPDRTGRHPRCGSGARATLIHTGAVAAAVPERHEVLAGVVPGPGADQFLGRPRYWGWNRPGFGSTALRWGFGRWHNEDPARPAVGSSRARPSHSATASAGRPTSRVAGPDADQGQHGSGQPLKGLTSRSGEPLPNSGSTAAEPPLDAVHGTAHRSLLPKAVGFSQPPTDTRVGSLMRLWLCRGEGQLVRRMPRLERIERRWACTDIYAPMGVPSCGNAGSSAEMHVQMHDDHGECG
jgi:hypothetical protein